MFMPFLLTERICPLGRMCADPPPFSDTDLPGGVCAALVWLAGVFAWLAVVFPWAAGVFA
jgi:hypothetical protein